MVKVQSKLSPADTEKEIQHQIDVLEKHIKNNPKDYTMMFALALRYSAVEEYQAASKICHKLMKLGAEQKEVYLTGVQSDLHAGFYDDAIVMANKGLEKLPENYELHLYLAAALQKAGRYKEAAKIYEKAQKYSSESLESFLSQGTFLSSCGKNLEALEVYKKGLEKYPDSSNLLNNIGAAYINEGDVIKGTEYYVTAVRKNPKNPKALINLGSAMGKLENAFVGIKFYDEALKLDPENSAALCAKANAMSKHGLVQEAMPLFEKGSKFTKESNFSSPVFKTNFSNYIFFQHYVPDRPRDHIFKEIKQFAKQMCSELEEKRATEFGNNSDKDKKIRVGLLSKGFNVHPVGQMIYKALEHLDKNQFELFCYSELPADNHDYLTDKLYEQMDQVRTLRNQPNYEVLKMIRDDEIDILIEMTGHSEGGQRLPIIAERAAPVQVKWVGGLFNSSGLPQMDWLISDHIETPEGVDKWYTEKIYRMPDDYIVYYPPYYAPDVSEPPARENGYITFGNLNNLAKTNSYSIELWSKILHAVPDSKMLMKGNKMHEDFAQDHIYKAFEGHGITRDRVIIEGGEKHRAFLDVYNRIDIALDPHPYTGGLTTCEALWMGVPVVTLPGETFAGRHAATHLTNADMAEWIAKDEQDYIDIAVKWANDIEGLAKLRAGMRDHVAKTPLVDGPRFAKNLEIALRHMWGQWCDEKEAAGKPKKISKPKPKKSKRR